MFVFSKLQSFSTNKWSTRGIETNDMRTNWWFESSEAGEQAHRAVISLEQGKGRLWPQPSVLKWQLANKPSPLPAGKDQRAVVRRVTGRNWQIPKRKPSCLFKDCTVTVASCWDVCRCTKKLVLFLNKSFLRNLLKVVLSADGADQTHPWYLTDPSKPAPFLGYPVKGQDSSVSTWPWRQVFQRCFV